MLTIAIDARLVGANATGDSTYWRGLVFGLSQISSKARLLLLSNQDRPEGVPNSENLEWIRVPGKSWRWWSLVQFPSAARRLGADLIHVQYNLSPLAKLSAITTIHDVSFRIGPQWFRPRDRLILNSFISGTIKRAARVLTVSETSRKEIERYYPSAAEKVRVTPLAAGVGIESIEGARASELVQLLGIDSPFLLTVGTRWPRKNMSLAILAVESLPPEFPHKLVVTGKSGWGVQLESSRAISVGYVDDKTLSALYSCAAAYLAPSLHEGFGIPVLEAFRCGCPVIASMGGALPEVVGDAGIVVESWDSAIWAETIASVLRDSSKLDSMRQRGLERERSFTWAETARKTLAVYEELAP